MDFKTSTLKINSQDKMVQTMDLCSKIKLLSSVRMEAGYLLRVPRSQRQVNSSAKEI
jgi:hypothetical protein